MGCDEEDEEDGDFEGEDETVEEEEEEEEEDDDDDIVLALPLRWRAVICLFEETIDPADSASLFAPRPGLSSLCVLFCLGGILLCARKGRTGHTDGRRGRRR